MTNQNQMKRLQDDCDSFTKYFLINLNQDERIELVHIRVGKKNGTILSIPTSHGYHVSDMVKQDYDIFFGGCHPHAPEKLVGQLALEKKDGHK